jgi:hypothetical protein
MKKERKEVTVRFVIDAGLWRAFKGASMIRDKNPFDEIRKLIKQQTAKRISRAPVKR